MLDLEDVAGNACPNGEMKRPAVRHRKRGGGVLAEMEPGESVVDGVQGGGEPIHDCDIAEATQPTTSGLRVRKAPVGSSEWLAERKDFWRALRMEKRRLRHDQQQSESMPGRGGPHGKRSSLRGGLGGFYVDQTATVHNSHWHVLTVQETATPGELTLWVLLDCDSKKSTLHQIPIVVPRQLYVNMRASHDSLGWVKVSRALPRGAPSLFMYEVSMREDEFVRSSSDMAKWLHHKDVHAVYHTHVTPLLRAITHLGCCCHVARGVPRRSPHEGFVLHELRPSANQEEYLGKSQLMTDSHAGSDGGTTAVAPGIKLLQLYAEGSASRGVFGVYTPHDSSGMMILIRPRGSAISADARSAMHGHPAAEGMALTLEACDTWEEAYSRVGKLLPSMQSAARGPVVALAQTSHDTPSLHELIPQLKQLPTISVPNHRTDAAAVDGGSLALGGAWQASAVELALERYGEFRPWWTNRVLMARFAGVPVGCLPVDASVFAIDMLMHRRLLQSGHLSWLSPSPSPDLGGHSDSSTDGGGTEDIASPEVTSPGMYRCVCIELQLDNLAVDTILEARHVYSLEGLDLAKDMIRSAASGDAASLAVAAAHGTSDGGDDDGTAVSSALRVLRQMLSEWMRNVLHECDTRADSLLMNLYRWLCSTTSLLYDPALHRMVQLLMKKVWMQLLAELRSLGATVVHASYTRLIIATEKTSLSDAHAYADFLLGSLSAKPIFSFLRLTPMRFWSSLLFLDALNFGGLSHMDMGMGMGMGIDGQAADASTEAGLAAAPEPKVVDIEATANDEADLAVREAHLGDHGNIKIGVMRDLTQAEAHVAEAVKVAKAAEGEYGDAEVEYGDANAEDGDVNADDACMQPVTTLPCDLRAVETMSMWNIAFHLPPIVRERFLHLVKLYVAEPWMLAANDAEAQGRPAPSSEEIERKTVSFFDTIFSRKLLEEVDQIRRTIPSTGEAERISLREGTATDEVIARSFPNISGSHLELSDPALEFVKQICHVCSLEPCLEEQLHRTRKNALKMLKVDEFAPEGRWADPSLSFVLPEVVCEFCGHCRDLDLCRDEHWACDECANPYAPEAVESRLVQLAKRRSVAFQLQDVQCAKCNVVKRCNLAPVCQKCAGPFALRQAQESMQCGLEAFARIASYHEMPWLAETVAFLHSGGGIG